MGLKPDTTDEISGTSRPLIEIPLPLSESVARTYLGRVLAMIVITGTVVVLAVATLYFESCSSHSFGPCLHFRSAFCSSAFSRSSDPSFFCRGRATPVSRSEKMGYGFETHKVSVFMSGKT